MQTIKIEIEDSLYHKIVESDINIQERLKAFLDTLFDDKYPTLSTKEAQQRVSDALQRYEKNPSSFTPFDTNYKTELDNYIKSL